MKRLILALSLAAAALSGCAAFTQTDAHSGASGVEEQRPYPKSASDLGLF